MSAHASGWLVPHHLTETPAFAVRTNGLLGGSGKDHLLTEMMVDSVNDDGLITLVACSTKAMLVQANLAPNSIV